MKGEDRNAAEKKLQKYDVEYLITELSNGNFNLFFGKKECVDVVHSFGNVSLCELSSEQDFILGIMLGYDRLAQCERFLKRKEQETASQNI